MDNKITTSGLAAMLAIATGKQKKICEDFVSGLFSIVGEELARGENVRIKGFGTFKLVVVEPRKSVNIVSGESYEIPGHTKIVFVMAKELASLVNAPFNAFEAVEIADSVPTDILDGFAEVSDGDYSEALSSSITEREFSELGEGAPEDDSNDYTKSDHYSKESNTVDIRELSTEGIEDSNTEHVKNINTEDVEDPNTDDDYEDVSEPKKTFWNRFKFLIGFVAGLCAALAICWIALGYAEVSTLQSRGHEDSDMVDKINSPEAFGSPESELVLHDSLDRKNAVAENIDVNTERVVDNEAVPTKPSDTPVYDTVSTTRYLTTIAKEHYGNFNLWPIIYEENAAILGHPDRIKPGTRVVVPPLSKYNIDPNDKNQVNAMKQKGKEIYDKFK